MASASNLTRRLLTALVVIPVVVVVIYLGGWYFAAVLTAAGLVGQYELYGLLRKAGSQPFEWYGLLAGTYVLLVPSLPQELPHAAIAAGLAALPIILLPLARREKPLHDLSATALGLCYPVLPLMALGLIRNGAWGNPTEAQLFAVTLSMFLLIWSADTAAYAVGSLWGRRPLHPELSPKKTWEGYFGGAIGALVVAVVIKILALSWMPWTVWLPIALVCGAVSPLGDLAESALKRAADVKDSGVFFPGHGGMLDRIDSVIVSAPLVLALLFLI